ncbi:MAG: hypothetical protein H6Q16_1313 [Bacteroidetes bacterium]|nr:hypothetical protein [Bacteroidota bacterium]
MKKTFLLLAVITAICFSSCSVGRIKNLEMEPDEAIVIAKINVIQDSSKYLKNAWDIAWNNSKKYSCSCDSNGYIYMRLPIAKNSITNILYKNDNLRMFDQWYYTNLKENKIYYIGDITIYWDSLLAVSDILYKQEQTLAMSGVMGGMIGGAIAGGIIAENNKSIINDKPGAVIVKDNYEETTKYFKKLFPTDKIITKALLEIKLDTIKPEAKIKK